MDSTRDDYRKAYNHTELYQLCIQSGTPVIPSMTKEELIEALETDAGHHETNPMDDWRFGIMAYLIEHWKRASSQLFCPAKSGDPDACKQCVDAQVIHCLTINPGIESGVLQHIKGRIKWTQPKK
jgi:hypothetical protein